MYFFGSTYFPELLMRNIFQIMFCMIFVTEFFILLSTMWNDFKTPGKKEKKDKGSMPVMVIGYWGAISLDPICASLFHQLLPSSWFWVGAGIILLGVFVRVNSVWTLRKYFTLHVQVGSRQEIVRKGLYQCLRHPAYTGSILTLLGVAVCFRTLWGIFATAIIAAVVYGYRIKIEEKLMEKNFGQVYLEYEKSTKRLIPYLC